MRAAALVVSLAFALAGTTRCAHGVDDTSALFKLDSSSAGGAAGEPAVTAGGGEPAGGPAGSGGAAGALGGSGGLGGASQASGGGSGNGGVSVTAGGAGAGGAGAGGAGTGGNGGAAGSGQVRDGGGDALSDVTTRDVVVEADVNCVRETTLAFCLRVAKNCGDVMASDNCGNAMTANCGMCGPFMMCGGGGQPNVCGALTGAGKPGTVSSSNPGVAPEDMAKAFDSSSATKWFAGNGIKTGWIAFQFAGAATHIVTSYALTSANDQPGRDPNAWQLKGSTDGQAWTTLDTKTGEMFASRFQTISYTFVNTTAYPRYRLNVTANNAGSDLQLAELQLFGQ